MTKGIAKKSTTPVKEQVTTEPAYVPQPIEVGKKSSGPKTIGMPKSKKPWKTSSKRSGI